jgi:hypothetical protein
MKTAVQAAVRETRAVQTTGCHHLAKVMLHVYANPATKHGSRLRISGTAQGVLAARNVTLCRPASWGCIAQREKDATQAIIWRWGLRK